MYRTKLENPQARKAAAECLRTARVSRSYNAHTGAMHRICADASEVFGFAITIATNLKTIERKAGNWDRGNAYRDAGRAMDRAH